MSRLTVIVVPDEASAVRRYQIPRRLVKYAPWAAVVLALLLIAGSIDYVLWFFSVLLALKAITGFVKIRRRM